MLKSSFTIKTSMLESLWSQKRRLKARFRQNQLQGLSFARGELLRLVGAPNESLRLIKIYYMLKYSFRIKTSMLESLWGQKSCLKARFRQNYLQGLSFARGDLLRLVGAQNESLIHIIIYYIFKYTFGTKTTLLDSLRSQKSPLTARFWQNQL